MVGALREQGKLALMGFICFTSRNLYSDHENSYSGKSNNLKMGFCAPYTSLWIFCSQSDVILI
ncbi:hypothetical protein SCA6_008599 [Theobroma cacao]